MLSARHEALIQVFRNRPSMVAELLADVLGVAVPPHETVRLDPADLTELVPTEYRADAVLVLGGSDERSPPALAVVLEAQLRPNQRKRRSWVAYVGGLHARLDCPTALLVVCVDAATARWCAEPILYGPGNVLQPHVLGPDRVPVVTDPAVAAAEPELTVLSAIAHGADRPEVLDALAGVLATSSDELFTLYSDLVLAALPAAARRHLEAVMTIRQREYLTETVRRYVGQGRVEGRVEGSSRVEGKAESVLAVLESRGVPVPDEARDRITTCRDEDELNRWVRRAAVVTRVDELFG